eukprot:5627484-Prymnesium_polylepis.1
MRSRSGTRWCPGSWRTPAASVPCSVARRLGRRTSAKSAIDRTKYGRSRVTTKSFYTSSSGDGVGELGRDCGRGLPPALAGGVDGGDGGAIKVSTAPIASTTRAR